MLQQIVNRHVFGRHQLHALKLREARVQFRFSAVSTSSTVFFTSSLPSTRHHVLGFVIGQIERLHYAQFAVAQLSRQRRTQCAQHHLARQIVFVAARLRSMRGAAVPPQRRSNGAHARAAGAFLLPQLLAGTRYFMARLGRRGSRPPRGGSIPHRFIEQRLVYFGAEHCVRKLDRAHYRAVQVHNVYTAASSCCPYRWRGVRLRSRRSARGWSPLRRSRCLRCLHILPLPRFRTVT